MPYIFEDDTTPQPATDRYVVEPETSGPELRQGTKPSVWSQLTSVFKDPGKEAARATKSIVDAEALNISPSAAYAIPEKTMKRAFDTAPEMAGRRDRTLQAIKKFNDTGVETGWQESMLNKIQQIPLQMQMAAGRLMQEFEELTPAGMGGAPMQMGFGLPPVDVMNVVAGQMENKEVQSLGREFAEGKKAAIQRLEPNVAPGSLKDYTASAVNSIGLNVAYMLPSLVTGNPAFGLALMGLHAKGEGYGEQREGGSDPWKASLASLGYGASEMLTEFIPMGIYLKPGKQFVRRLVEAEFTEIPTEAVNTLVTAAIDKVTIKPETTLRDALDQVEETIYVTALSTLGLAGASHVVNKSIAKDLEGTAKQVFNQAKTAALNNNASPKEAVKAGIDAAATIPEGKAIIEAKQSALVEEASTVEMEQSRLAAEIPAIDEQSFDETLDAVFSGERNLEEMIIEDTEEQPDIENVSTEQPATVPVETKYNDTTKIIARPVRDVGLKYGDELPENVFLHGSRYTEKDIDNLSVTNGKGGGLYLTKQWDIADSYADGKETHIKAVELNPDAKIFNLSKEVDRYALSEIIQDRTEFEVTADDLRDMDFHERGLSDNTEIGNALYEANVHGVIDHQGNLDVMDDVALKTYNPKKPDQIIADNIKLLSDSIATTGEATIEPMMELGRVAFEEGSTLETFTAKMKEIAGDMWEKVKAFIQVIFDKLKEERGSFSTKDVKPKVRETTGQIKTEEIKDLNAAFKKAERYSKIGFMEGVKVGKEQANVPKQESVKGRVRRITGQTSIVGMIREDEALRAAFKKAEQAGRIAYREGNKAGIAEQKEVIKVLIAKARQQAQATEEINKDIKAVKKLAKVGKGIDVEFQRLIKSATENLDFTKLSEKKIDELNELQKLIDESGSTIGIPQKRIDELSRLAKTPIRDMTPENIKELRDQLEHLVEVGKVLAEMKYQYKEDERLKKLDEVVSTTNNLDPHVVLSEDRMRDKIKVAGVTFYTDTLHTPRVAELADNFQKGPQQEFIRRMGETESQVSAKALQRQVKGLEKVKELGITEIPGDSESAIKMRINMLYREGATTQAETLMDHYGYNTVPTLTEQEEGVLAIIEQDMKDNKAGLAAVYEDLEQEIFPEQDVYYLPLKYEKEEEIVPDTQVEGRGRTTHTFDGFKNKRRPGVNKLPRVDILQIWQEAILEQEWYKGMQPVIQDIKSVVLTEEYKNAAGGILHSWWKDQIDITARRGWSASAQLNATSSLMRRVRHNLNTAILGFKASTIVMQPMAVFDAMAYVNAKLGTKAAGKVLSEVTKSFLIPGRTKEIVAGSDALQQRQGGELAIHEELLKAKGETVKDKLTRTAFKLISQADLKTAAGVQEAVRKVMIQEGMSENEALKEAEFIMKLSQGDSSITHRPHILSKGEGARTWFTFQTFVMNRWGMIVHDLIAGKISHGTAKEKMAGLISIGILMMAGLVEDDARKLLYELIAGKEMKADNRSLPEKVLINLSSTMPFFGSLINAASSGMDASPPAIRTLKTGIKGLYNTFTGKDSEKRFKGLRDAIETGLVIGVGFPGTAQFFDLLEGSITNDKKRR